MERSFLKEWDIRLLILSRGRSTTITTHKLLPEWVEILVPESEKKDYELTVPNPLLTVPDSVVGLGALRNWVLKNFKEDIVIMIDDDIKKFYCLTGERTKAITDPLQFVQILINTAVMAKDAGVNFFGFSQTDIRKFNGCDPFSLTYWVGCIVGVIGRKFEFRNDKFKVDIDYCLKNLLVNRILWVDTRYYAYQARDNNVGGNSAFRTEEDFNKSVDSLCKKWGKYLKKQKSHGNNISLKMNVKRKQAIKYE